MLRAVAAATIAAAIGLVAAPPAGAVLGGSNAPKGTAAATARIDLPDDVCSGSVVAPRLVLTALHCVQADQDAESPDRVARDAKVTVGNPNLGGALQERRVLGAIVAPQVTPPPAITRQVDAVLLILDRPVGAAPMPLAPAADAAAGTAPGHPVLLTGFGAASSPGVGADGRAARPTASAHLKRGAMTAALCPGTTTSTDRQACAVPAASGTPDAPVGTACSGDSGAPVTTTGADGVVRQVAVLSGAVGPDLCSQGNTIVLTPVSAALSGWVAQAATGQSLPDVGPVPQRCRSLHRAAARAARSVGRARRSVRRHGSRSATRALRTAERRSRHAAGQVHRIC